MNNETEFGVEEREHLQRYAQQQEDASRLSQPLDEGLHRAYRVASRPAVILRMLDTLTRAEAQRDEALNELGFQLRSRVNAIGRSIASRRRGEYVTSLQAEVDKQQKRAEAAEAQLAAVRGKLEEANKKLAVQNATINMAVTRLGGIVESQPTGRHNFLQRIDQLVAAEAALRERGKG